VVLAESPQSNYMIGKSDMLLRADGVARMKLAGSLSFHDVFGPLIGLVPTESCVRFSLKIVF
jgi:hypothetical protein